MKNYGARTDIAQVWGHRPGLDSSRSADLSQYPRETSTKEPEELGVFYAHAEAKRLLAKIGQGERIGRAPDKEVVFAVALARGIDGLMLPAHDAAEPEQAIALLRYAAQIEDAG